jgi:hypothetical protein
MGQNIQLRESRSSGSECGTLSLQFCTFVSGLTGKSIFRCLVKYCSESNATDIERQTVQSAVIDAGVISKRTFPKFGLNENKEFDPDCKM